MKRLMILLLLCLLLPGNALMEEPPQATGEEPPSLRGVAPQEPGGAPAPV